MLPMIQKALSSEQVPRPVQKVLASTWATGDDTLVLSLVTFLARTRLAGTRTPEIDLRGGNLRDLAVLGPAAQYFLAASEGHFLGVQT
jgi:hypothetical protein